MMKMKIRQINEKSIPINVSIMKWNPNHDLVTLVFNNSDDVHLHRLEGWQKVWSVNLGILRTASSIKCSKTHVTDLEWRPDGKLIAASYALNVFDPVQSIIKIEPPDDADPKQKDFRKKCSSIALIEHENATIIHVIEINEESIVTCLNWRPKINCSAKTQATGAAGDGLGHNFKYTDYLMMDPVEALEPLKIPTKQGSKLYGSVPMRKFTEESLTDMSKVKNIDTMMLLAAGTDDGQVLLFALGLLQVSAIKLDGTQSLVKVSMSDDYSKLFAFHKNAGDVMNEESSVPSNTIKLTIFDTNLFKDHSLQFLTLSQVHSKIITLIRYLNETITSLLDSWEDILLEIELKLSCYFDTSESSSSKDTDAENGDRRKSRLSSDEFMELLVFGTASETLEKFLNDLGEKGLKKLGQSIELTYSNVQKLIVNQLERVNYHLISYLTVLKSMSLWTEEFGCLNLDTKLINNCINLIGSLQMKCLETQQVIDTSVRNVKSFFRWLYSVMVRLFNSDSVSSSSSDMVRVSQQDLQFVAAFIDENFDSFESKVSTKDEQEKDSKISSDEEVKGLGHSLKRSSMFTLEPVGQYFRNGPLIYKNCPMNNLSINPWIQFLNAYPTFPYQDEREKERCEKENNFDSPLIKHNLNNSLIQEYHSLIKAINELYESIKISVPSLYQNVCLHNVYGCDAVNFISSFITSFSGNCNYSLTSVDKDCALIIKFPMSGVSESINNYQIEASIFEFINDDENNLQVASFNCYDNESAIILIRNVSGSESYICKVNFSELVADSVIMDIKCNQDASIVNDVYELMRTKTRTTINIKYLELTKIQGINWDKLAVSAARKVASVTSGKRVRLFDLDDTGFEEEDDDEDIDANSGDADEPME